MKSTELFGVVVRTIGLLIIMEVLWRLLADLEAAMIPPFSMGAEGSSWNIAFLLTQFLALLVGGGCFFRADGVVRLAYRGTLPDRDSS
jgi:hypothetical protein